MSILVLLPLFLAILLEVDAQKCSLEAAENAIRDRISEVESQPLINIISLQHNCLATSKRLGIYHSTSISVLYSSSNSAAINEIRYDWLCLNDAWLRLHENESYFNETRSDCYDCTDRTVNDYHCAR